MDPCHSGSMEGPDESAADVTEKIVDDSLETTEKVKSKFTVRDFLKSAEEMDEDLWEELIYESLVHMKGRKEEEEL